MTPTAMQFRDYVWPHNPETVKIERSKNATQLAIPHTGNAVQDFGPAGRAVSGAGRFVDEDCLDEFGRLAAAFSPEGSGLLILPGGESFAAVFCSLTMLGEAGPDCVRYEFLFREDASSAAEDSVVGETQTYTCAGGETIFQVAAAFGADADELLVQNPQIEWPNSLPAGMVVTYQ